MARANLLHLIPEAPDEPQPKELDSYNIYQKNKTYVVVNTLLPARGQHASLPEAKLQCKRNLLKLLLQQANILKQEILEEDGEYLTDASHEFQDELNC